MFRSLCPEVYPSSFATSVFCFNACPWPHWWQRSINLKIKKKKKKIPIWYQITIILLSIFCIRNYFNLAVLSAYSHVFWGLVNSCKVIQLHHNSYLFSTCVHFIFLSSRHQYSFILAVFWILHHEWQDQRTISALHIPMPKRASFLGKSHFCQVLVLRYTVAPFLIFWFHILPIN